MPQPPDPHDGPPPPHQGLPDLLARHLDTLRCFVRIHVSPPLREREQDSDIVQSVCAELLAHPARFEYQGEAAFRSWLYRAVLDRVRHKMRFHGADKRASDREEPPGPDGTGPLDSYAQMVTPSRIAMNREMQQALERAIDDLPEAQREVLVRARLLQMDHDAIGAELGISPANSRQLLHRAIARLAVVVAKDE